MGRDGGFAHTGTAMRYYNNCVSWDSSDVHCDGGLVDMINDNEDIERDEFLEHVDSFELSKLERELGYSTDPSDDELSMEDDWHVSYHRSTLHGETVYYFKWSGIEHVFKTLDEA